MASLSIIFISAAIIRLDSLLGRATGQTVHSGTAPDPSTHECSLREVLHHRVEIACAEVNHPLLFRSAEVIGVLFKRRKTVAPAS